MEDQIKKLVHASLFGVLLRNAGQVLTEDQLRTEFDEFEEKGMLDSRLSTLGLTLTEFLASMPEVKSCGPGLWKYVEAKEAAHLVESINDKRGGKRKKRGGGRGGRRGGRGGFRGIGRGGFDNRARRGNDRAFFDVRRDATRSRNFGANLDYQMNRAVSPDAPSEFSRGPGTSGPPPLRDWSTDFRANPDNGNSWENNRAYSEACRGSSPPRNFSADFECQRNRAISPVAPSNDNRGPSTSEPSRQQYDSPPRNPSSHSREPWNHRMESSSFSTKPFSQPVNNIPMKPPSHPFAPSGYPMENFSHPMEPTRYPTSSSSYQMEYSSHPIQSVHELQQLSALSLSHSPGLDFPSKLASSPVFSGQQMMEPPRSETPLSRTIQSTDEEFPMSNSNARQIAIVIQSCIKDMEGGVNIFELIAEMKKKGYIVPTGQPKELEAFVCNLTSQFPKYLERLIFDPELKVFNWRKNSLEFEAPLHHKMFLRPINETVVVEISRFLNVHRFSVRPVVFESEYQKLDEEIQEAMEKGATPPPSSGWQINDACMIVHENKKWVRAVILKPDGVFFHVYLLDVGLKRFVDGSSLKVMPLKFRSISPYAIPCQLEVDEKHHHIASAAKWAVEQAGSPKFWIKIQNEFGFMGKLGVKEFPVQLFILNSQGVRENVLDRCR